MVNILSIVVLMLPNCVGLPRSYGMVKLHLLSFHYFLPIFVPIRVYFAKLHVHTCTCTCMYTCIGWAPNSKAGRKEKFQIKMFRYLIFLFLNQSRLDQNMPRNPPMQFNIWVIAKLGLFHPSWLVKPVKIDIFQFKFYTTSHVLDQ